MFLGAILPIFLPGGSCEFHLLYLGSYGSHPLDLHDSCFCVGEPEVITANSLFCSQTTVHKNLESGISGVACTIMYIIKILISIYDKFERTTNIKAIYCIFTRANNNLETGLK
jgi:hypothetical protein